MKIKRIHAYQTTDGQLIVDREKYLAHERNLAFGAAVRGLVEENVDEGYQLDANGISNLILNNADSLRAILSGKAKRARRSKAASTTQTTSTTTTEAQQ